MRIPLQTNISTHAPMAISSCSSLSFAAFDLWINCQLIDLEIDYGTREGEDRPIRKSAYESLADAELRPDIDSED